MGRDSDQIDSQEVLPDLLCVQFYCSRLCNAGCSDGISHLLDHRPYTPLPTLKFPALLSATVFPPFFPKIILLSFLYNQLVRLLLAGRSVSILDGLEGWTHHYLLSVVEMFSHLAFFSSHRLAFACSWATLSRMSETIHSFKHLSWSSEISNLAPNHLSWPSLIPSISLLLEHHGRVA